MNQQDPSLSGNGKNLAIVVKQNGRSTVQLKDIQNGSILPLRHLSRNQPHSSPSLSWSGRYLAVITQRGNRRLAVIEDRLKGKFYRLRLTGQRDPIRLSIAPDARQLAIQMAYKGKLRVEMFDLTNMIEPDLTLGISGS